MTDYIYDIRITYQGERLNINVRGKMSPLLVNFALDILKKDILDKARQSGLAGLIGKDFEQRLKESMN